MSTRRRAGWSSVALCLFAALICLALDAIEQVRFHSIVELASFRVEDVKARYPLLSERAALALGIMSEVNDQLNAAQISQQPEPVFPRTSTSHLQDPRGACYSYSHVLAKALTTAGYTVRKLGLKHFDGRPAAHHLLEVHLDGHWCMFDPLLNYALHLPDGSLASTVELQENWQNLHHQIPAEARRMANYQAFYYTNWQRFAIVRDMPNFISFMEQREVSIRFWFLNLWRWAALLCLGTAAALYTPLWLIPSRKQRMLARQSELSGAALPA
jgi:hypothetical protein